MSDNTCLGMICLFLAGVMSVNTVSAIAQGHAGISVFFVLVTLGFLISGNSLIKGEKK